MAVLEALAAGTPVVITHPCNFPEVATSACGRVVRPEVDEIRDAIGECLRSNAIRRERMGAAGRALARRRYSWPLIGRQMAEVYDWIDGGRRPTMVEIF